MTRMSSSNKCVYVDILDDEGNVIGVAHASGYANNNNLMQLLTDINDLTDWDYGKRHFNDDDIWRTRMIELPKDATGCEIPLTTTLLYEKYGQKVTVYDYKYDPRIKEWSVDTIQGTRLATSLYLTPLDNWEKLEKDLDRCISTSSPFRYYSPSGLMCEAMVFNSIKQRIHNLRGEKHDC